MPNALAEGLQTIPGITLVETGEWNASSGPVTFTEEDLRAAVAAIDDPAVKSPRLRIGHTPATTGPEGSAGAFEEQPNIGKFTNLRLSANGQAVVADLVGVPAWLAGILPIAYPSRSIEGFYNVKTQTGSEHDFVITAVSVLGINMPAVETLEDLQIVFSEEGPAEVEIIEGERVAASRGGEMGTSTRAAVATEDLRRSFYDEVAQDDRYWWWIHAVYLDPPAVIADDDEGGYVLVPYDASGSEISWGEPVEVRVQWVEKDSGKVAASLPPELGTAAERFAAAADSRPSGRARKGGSADCGTTQPMDVNGTQLRVALGLEAEASDEEVQARLAARAEEAAPESDPAPEGDPPEADPADPPAEDPPEGDPEAPEETDPPEGDPDPEAGEDGTVQVDAATWNAVQRQAQDGAAARAEQVTERRESLLGDAVKAGKFPPSRLDHYRKLHKADPAGTEGLIASLEAGLVPLDERGTSAPESATDSKMPGILASFGIQPPSEN